MKGLTELLMLWLVLATIPGSLAIEQRYLLGDNHFQVSKVFNLTECRDYLPNCNSYDYTVCRDYQPWALQRCPAYCQYCPLDPQYTTTPPSCTDAQPHCNQYNADTCTNPLYIKWARDNCRRFCNLCHETTHHVFTLHHSTTPLPTTTDPNCHDTISNCASYGRKACTDYKDWAGVRCRAFCYLCGTSPPPTTPPPCVDALANCASYQKDTCVNPLYKSWAQNNCRAFCGLCTTTTQGATTTVHTTSTTTLTTTASTTTPTTTTTPYVHNAKGATGPFGSFMCMQKGHMYKEGETWEDGSQYTCTCQNAELNHIRCTDRCPVWNGLPDYCKSISQDGACPVIQCVAPDDSPL